jgi:HK97 family phage prohead protease
MIDRAGLEYKVQAVDLGRRIIQGYAAAHGNEDREGDIIDHGASVKALSRISNPGQVEVYIGHPAVRSPTALPVGVPLTIKADDHGIYTETEIFDGPVGDNLLHVARGLMRHGKALGLSIGYRVRPGGSKIERGPNGLRRRITDYDLHEYSFAGEGIVANPRALAVGVKAQGGGMQYRIRQDGDEYVVEEADSGEEESRHPTRAAAEAAMRRLMREGDEPETPGNMGKTADADADDEVKSVWTAAAINDLPDSAFLYVEPGGQKDGEGKTVPRSKRHFPVRDASGKLDAAHVRNAIARIPQSDAPGLDKAALQGRARRMLANLEGGSKMIDADAPEWQEGAVPRLYDLGARLQALAETVADEQKAMRFLGQEVQDGRVIRPAQCKALRALLTEVTTAVEEAELINGGQYGDGRAAYWRHAFDALDLELVS